MSVLLLLFWIKIPSFEFLERHRMEMLRCCSINFLAIFLLVLGRLILYILLSPGVLWKGLHEEIIVLRCMPVFLTIFLGWSCICHRELQRVQDSCQLVWWLLESFWGLVLHFEFLFPVVSGDRIFWLFLPPSYISIESSFSVQRRRVRIYSSHIWSLCFPKDGIEIS